MDSKPFQRKHLVPKLNLNKLRKQNDGLSSRETCALINSEREIEYDRAYRFEENKYISSRPELWNNRKKKENVKNMPNMANMANMANIELIDEVCELTIKLDDIRKGLASSSLTFGEAGKLLSVIRSESSSEHHSSDDLIFCLDLVEILWECINNDGLSCIEFSSLLSSMLNRSETEFNVLFQKMDADGDETLSWGEYISFLSQQQAHLWDQQESKNISYFRENYSISYNCNANHMFNKICIINGDLTSKSTLNAAKYAILTSDNSIQIRNSMTLQLESNIDISLRPKKIDESEKYNKEKVIKYNFNANTMRNRAAQQDANKNKHITHCTDLCSIIGSNDDGITKLAVSFMDRCVNIYNPSFNAPKNEIPIYLQSAMDRKQYNNSIHYDLEHGFYALDIPQCMEEFDQIQSTLLIGETYGRIGLYNYLDHNCLIRIGVHGIANSSGPCVIKQVKRVPRIGIVSCGMDNLIIVTDSTKWSTIRTLSGHTRGVYSIAFSLSHRMLISAGYDRTIRIWDPYIKKPLGLLKGHVSSVVDILINEQTNQIITASCDKKIKIWDVRTWKCLQTIRDTSTHQPLNELTSIQYDPYQSCLITAGSKFRKWYVQNLNNNINHNYDHNQLAPIVSICYSNIFKQIISIHVDEMVILWDVNSGQNSFEFKMNHQCITAAIDQIGKRLLTASQNGIIRIWNFNNGAIMHEFDKIDFEIKKLIYLPRTLHCIVACGYNSNIIRFPSHQAPPEANFLLQNKLHKTDVRAMCISNEYLLTGSADGMIIEWHIDSNVKSEIFYCPQPFISITTMNIKQLNNKKWHLFVGTEDGVIHIFEKKYHFVFITSIKDKYMFKEPILNIAINEKATRLMIADCDTEIKLFDISNLHKIDKDYILMKQWKPHKGCITSLIYIPSFNVFCSSSDSGQLFLHNLDGIFLGQFGQNNSWNIFNSNNNNNNNNNNNHHHHKENKKNHNLQEINSTNSAKSKPKTKRKSYFDDHAIYRPKFIKSVVTESIARTLLEDRSNKEAEKKKTDKTQFEQSLDKLMTELMKPKKRKRSCRRSSVLTIKTHTQRKNSRMKL